METCIAGLRDRHWTQYGPLLDKAAGYTSAGLVLTQMKDYRGAISELNHAVQLTSTSA